MSDDTKVILIYSSSYADDEDDAYNVLDSYSGIRVYARDRYDPRAGEGLPYFNSFEDARVYMGEHKGDMVQLRLSEARKLFPGERFADFC